MNMKSLQLGFLVFTGMAVALLALPLTIHAASSSSASKGSQGSQSNKSVDDLLEVYKQRRTGSSTDKKEAKKQTGPSKVRKSASSKRIVFHPSSTSKSTSAQASTSKKTPAKATSTK